MTRSSIGDPDQLEVVYYGTPVPGTVRSLGLLALVFDRIHFPNVYIPLDGFDADAVLKEADRIDASLNPQRRSLDDAILLGVLRFVPFARVLKDVCYFTGQRGDAFGGSMEQGTPGLVEQLDLLIHGPYPPNFTPVFSTGHTKGLPGGKEAIHYPGDLHYPANAFLYAGRNGLPLINDSPYLPLLPRPLTGAEAKNNATVLSTIMALQCVSFALPKLRVLQPLEIVEFREENKGLLKPFRRAVLHLSKELNAAISADSSATDIEAAAKFIVDTEVAPQLDELKNAIEKRNGRWYDRAFDTAKQLPEIASAFCEMPWYSAVAKILIACGGVLVDMKKDAEAKADLARSGMHYLLRLRNLD